MGATPMSRILETFLRENAKKTMLETLLCVNAVLSDENKWCKGALARNKNKRSVLPYGRSAQSWCLIGAVEHILGRNWPRVREVLSELNAAINEFAAPSQFGVLDFNDARDTGFQDIKEILNIAIRNNREQALG
jgi:hypothetical protein